MAHFVVLMLRRLCVCQLVYNAKDSLHQKSGYFNFIKAHTRLIALTFSIDMQIAVSLKPVVATYLGQLD